MKVWKKLTFERVITLQFNENKVNLPENAVKTHVSL